MAQMTIDDKLGETNELMKIMKRKRKGYHRGQEILKTFKDPYIQRLYFRFRQAPSEDVDDMIDDLKKRKKELRAEKRKYG
jgi:hypothetical protein